MERGALRNAHNAKARTSVVHWKNEGNARIPAEETVRGTAEVTVEEIVVRGRLIGLLRSGKPV